MNIEQALLIAPANNPNRIEFQNREKNARLEGQP